MIKFNKNKKAEETATPTALVKHLNGHNTSASNQRAIILAAIMSRPRNTIELRQNFFVMAPAARISELKNMGYRIRTGWVSMQTADGVWHRRVANYFLLPGVNI